MMIFSTDLFLQNTMIKRLCFQNVPALRWETNRKQKLR